MEEKMNDLLQIALDTVLGDRADVPVTLAIGPVWASAQERRVSILIDGGHFFQVPLVVWRRELGQRIGAGSALKVEDLDLEIVLDAILGHRAEIEVTVAVKDGVVTIEVDKEVFDEELRLRVPLMTWKGVLRKWLAG